MHVSHQQLHNLMGGLAAALLPFIVEALQGSGGNPAAQAGATLGGQQPSAQPSGGMLGLTGASTSGQAAQQATSGGAGTDLFGSTAQQTAQQPAQSAVTADDVQKLIAPMVQNEKVKAALVAQMNEMGITNLPDARPEQLQGLFDRFKEVERQAIAAGLLGGQGNAPSLI